MAKASGLHPDIRRFESYMEYHFFGDNMDLEIKKAFQNSPSDKESDWHSYGFIYELIIKSMLLDNQRSKLKLLEIGILYGDSLQVWNESDIFDTIVGIDVKNSLTASRITEFSKDGVTTIFANAYDRSLIDSIKDDYGMFDIIIDDGPHDLNNQFLFLDFYGRLLNDGGLLVCEDITTETLALWTPWIKRSKLMSFNMEADRNSESKDNILIILKK